MKKLFLVLLLFVFVGITQAQNTNKPTSTMTEQQIANKIFERTLELIRVRVATAIALDSATIAAITSSTTSNGGLESTQLQVLSELQNKINMGGAQTYSLRRQDFTATLKAGGKSIAIAGLNGGTVSYLNFAYGWLINSTTGAKTYLTTAVDSVAGASIRFPSATAFTATDVIGELVFVYPEKTIDKANDVVKGTEQSPIWARYQIDEIYDGTNLAAGTNYYPASTGASMDGYKNLSFTGKLIDADSTVTLTVEVLNDEDDSAGDWVQIYGYDLKNNTTVNSIAASHATTTFALKFENLNCSKYRVKIITGDATNTVIIKQRRVF